MLASGEPRAAGGPDGGPGPLRNVFIDILRSSSLYAVVPVGQRLASVLLLPVYTRLLTPSDYGTIELLVQTMYVLGALLGGAFSFALGYHYFQKSSVEWRKSVASTCILGSAMIGVPGMALGLSLCAPLSVSVFRSPALAPYFRILFVTMAVDFILEAIMQWLRVEDRPAVFVTASLFRLGLTLACTPLLLIVFHMGVAGVFVSNLIAVSVTTAPLVFYSFRSLGLRFQAGVFLRMLRFSFPLALTGMAVLVMDFGNRFILERYHTLADVGLYGLANKFGMLMALIYGTFQSYWNAQVYQILRREDGDVAFARVCTYLVMVLSWCALGLIFLAGPVLRILTTPAFQSAVLIVPLVVAAYFVRGIGDLFRSLFLVENHPGFDTACNWLGAAVCFAAYFLLIPRFGTSGAAGATLIAFLGIGVLAIVWVGRLRPLRVEASRLTRIGGVAGFLVWLFFFVPVPGRLGLQISWAVLLLASYPLLLVVLRFPTEGEYSQLRSAYRVARRIVWPAA
jgi:O-antigen/teichoic acid export membrane protein